MTDAYAGYRHWAKQQNARPAEHAEFGLTFAAFIKAAGCDVSQIGGDYQISGIALTSPADIKQINKARKQITA